jgi:hypothetical protein
MKFEDFLMVKCMEQTHALDDDLPDVYEAWIVEQDVSDIIKWATEWHNYLLEDAQKYKVAFDVKFKGSTPDDLEKLIKETFK